MARLVGATGCTGPALLIAGALTLVDVLLVNFHQRLFGAAWRYVMWEGGVVETLTAFNFLLAAGAFASAAAGKPPGSAGRRWLVLSVLASLVLTGEEVNYGQGMLVLNLRPPRWGIAGAIRGLGFAGPSGPEGG